MKKKHESMTRAELIKALAALETESRAPSHKAASPPRGRLLHELHAHQVELEAQNQELRDAHQLLEESRNRDGHAQGDELLRRAAQVFKAAFRAEHVVARIGGDEFAATLPNTNSADAEDIVQRVRTHQAALNAAGVEPRLSLSLGSVTARKGKPLIKALRQADERMYREKAHSPAARSFKKTNAVIGRGNS